MVHLTGTVPAIPARPRSAPVVVVASVTAIAAGAGHLAAGGQHLRESVGFASFFFAVGLLQIAFGAHVLRGRGAVPNAGALLGMVGLVLLYVYSRAVAVPLRPFTDGPEALDPLGLLVVGCELAAAVALAVILPGPVRRRLAKGLLVAGGTLWLLWFFVALA